MTKIHCGWAFTADADQRQKDNAESYKAISHLRNKDHVDIGSTPSYGKTNFSGTLNSDEARALTNQQILLIADRGSLCFGGSISRHGDLFSGSYNTD